MTLQQTSGTRAKAHTTLFGSFRDRGGYDVAQALDINGFNDAVHKVPGSELSVPGKLVRMRVNIASFWHVPMGSGPRGLVEDPRPSRKGLGHSFVQKLSNII